MKINEVYRQICDNPHDDAPRLLFADLVEPSEPTWAAFIRRQIEAARRLRKGDTWTTFGPPPEAVRWSASLLPFVSVGSPNSIEFHRGFPTLVAMQPEMFAEYGEHLFRLAPIRHVDFEYGFDENAERVVDENGAFPILPALRSPALSRLESIGFINVELPRDWAQQLMACPYLDSCLYLSLHSSRHKEKDLVALTESPALRKMIHILSGPRVDHTIGLLSQRSVGTGGPEYTTYYYNEVTKELERKHGYIPWLHDYAPDRLDVHWYVASGRMPKFAAGSLPPKDEWYELPDPIRHPATW